MTHTDDSVVKAILGVGAPFEAGHTYNLKEPIMIHTFKVGDKVVSKNGADKGVVTVINGDTMLVDVRGRQFRFYTDGTFAEANKPGLKLVHVQPRRRRIQGWLLVRADDYGNSQIALLENKSDCIYPDTIACKYIDIEEGDGLEEI